MSLRPSPGSRLRLPTDTDALRRLRHNLRTPINPILGYCELIMEEAGDTAPAPFKAGMRRLHRLGRRMLKLTNELFSDQPSPLHHLTCREILLAFRAAAKDVAALAVQLERQARAAALSASARDLRRIRTAAGQWRKRVEELLAQHCE